MDYTAETITIQLPLPAVEKVLHPRSLSLVEREQIADLRAAGHSIRHVAATLHRPPSTVSRELASPWQRGSN